LILPASVDFVDFAGLNPECTGLKAFGLCERHLLASIITIRRYEVGRAYAVL